MIKDNLLILLGIVAGILIYLGDKYILKFHIIIIIRHFININWNILLKIIFFVEDLSILKKIF